jgi:condensin-2 complex subunit G2
MVNTEIVMEHASDSSSSAVRATALEAATALLEAPQSHAVLRALLPSLGNLIHDKAERVRLAAVKMLRRIKQIPGIRFYHVVPVDHLTARLSEEKRLHQGNPRNAVAKELTALMLNSYFPQGTNVSGADQLQRTLTFLLTDSSAALVFYANLVDHLEVESITKFIVMMLACLKSAVNVDQAQQVTEQSQANSKKRRRRGASSENDQTTENSNKNLMSASNTSLMAGLSENICVLWESIEPMLSADDENQPSKDLLTKIFAEAHLANILSHFDTWPLN